MPDLADRISSLLPLSEQGLLRAAGELANEAGVSAFGVGGMVRDLLLDCGTKDLDITVEGDGIAFARRLAARIGARPKCYEKFGTATILLPYGLRLDVATARSEVYARPAALPRVAPGTLREDLFRRDFTINAMAASLLPGEFGRLVDPFHGVRDLGERRIRVLHDRSYIDDPTRIFRAFRFEGRLGFHVARTDERLIAEALSAALPQLREDYRIATELKRILQEREAGRILRRMRTQGVLEAVRKRGAREKALETQMKRIERILREIDSPG